MTDPRQNSSEDSLEARPPSAPTAVSGSIESPIVSKTWECSCRSHYAQIPRGTEFDPRIDLSHPVHGWPALATVMGNCRDFEAFPRFRDFNIKSLLYYQCELSALREELHALEWDDHLQSEFDDAPKFSSRVDSLLLSQRNTSEREHRQIDLVNKIRDTLDKYSTSHALVVK
jgi:hypothetical protein